MSIRSLTRLVVLVAGTPASLLISPPAQAATLLGMNVDALSPAGSEQFFSNVGEAPGPFLVGGASVSGSDSTGGGTVAGGAAVGAGYFRGYTYVSGISTGSGLSAEVSSGFSDSTVVINDPALTGTVGTATANIGLQFDQFLDATIFDTIGGAAATFSSVDICASDACIFRQQQRSVRSDGIVSQSGAISGPATLNFTFTYGTPFRIRGTFTMNAGLVAFGDFADGGGAQGTAFSSFPASMRWLGIDGLSAGAVVSGAIDWSGAAPLPSASDLAGVDFSFVSSGPVAPPPPPNTDPTNPSVIPLPAGGVLLLSAFGLMGWASRRRRHAPSA
jgi:hypothetical protein